MTWTASGIVAIGRADSTSERVLQTSIGQRRSTVVVIKTAQVFHAAIVIDMLFKSSSS